MDEQRDLIKKAEADADQFFRGKRVDFVRYMHDDEMEAMGWHRRALVIQFTDGTILFASSDAEGNDAGELFGQDPKGKRLDFYSL